MSEMPDLPRSKRALQIAMPLGLRELYGMRIYTDNRIKIGNFLPYKHNGKATGDLRCNRKTLKMLQKAINEANQ